MIANCITSIGGRHVENKGHCQDASGCWIHDDLAIVAVSDGHSSEECFRSDVGSKIAIQVSLKILSDLVTKKTFWRSVFNNRDEYLKEIESKILIKWKEKVREYSDEIEYDEREKELLKNTERKTDLEIYGATLIVGIISPDYIIGLQVGDGCMYTINDDGRVSKETSLIDKKCKNNLTTSLCNDDVSKFHHFARPIRSEMGIVVTTDGFSNCFGSSNDEHAVRILTSRMDVKDEWYSYICPEIIKLTTAGDKDDVSFAIACRSDTDFRLYEVLSTGSIPVLKHEGTIQKNYSKISSDGHKGFDNSIIETGMLSVNSIVYKGTFDNGVLSKGIIRFPLPWEKMNGIEYVELPENGLFLDAEYDNNSINMDTYAVQLKYNGRINTFKGKKNSENNK